ncbi:hypothetical protein Tco_0112155 [Tanacetum coccineum]
MWEEFTQSIHTFTEDKRNLAQHTLGKKKVTLILILSIRFTKLIIIHLQWLHNFHPRPESPLHLPTEEPVLGNLKFSAKGTKREVFGMTIPNELINDVIRGSDYYDAYLEKVSNHQRHLAGKEVSDPESPTPKPAKPTKQAKPKVTKQPTVSKTIAKKPKPAPAKPQEKKQKLVSESSVAPQLAKHAKAGKVVKKRTVKSSKQLVDEFVDEGVPAAKPRLEDTEEAILQKVLEESLTDAYPTQRGPLPPVVFRETDTGKLQPLPEVPGKGKEKVGEEQAAQVLLHLQTPKKKSPAEQYIFQRHTPVPSEPAGHEESSSLYAELGLSGSDTESDEEMPSVVRSGAQDEGQAGPDPGKLDEGQAGPNPDDVAESQPLPTPSVLAGPNLEHSDVEITDPSSQPQPEHMDEGFIATAYPEVQENLKLTVDEQMIPEEPVSSTGTLSSLQHLTKDFSYGDQFIDDKPSEANYEKTTADTEAESMVSVTIQQDTSVIPPMTSPVIGPVPRPDSPNVHWPLPTTTTTTSATTTTTLPLPPQPQQGPSDPIIIKRMGELEELIANLVEENQALKQGSRINKLETMDLPKMIREQTMEFIDSQEIDQKINESVKEVVISSVKHAMRAPLRARFKDLPTSDMKEILLQRMLEENYDKGHADHRVAYEALQDSIHRDECEDFDPPLPPPPPPLPSGVSGASGTTGASDYAQAPLPPPPSSSTHQGGQSTSTAAPSSSKTAASAEYSAWTMTDTRIKPLITMIPDDLYMDDETTADEQVYSSGEETIPSSDLPVPTNNWASALKTTYVPPPENSLLAQTGDIATFMDWYCKRQGISELTPKDLEGPAYEIVKYNVSKPLPLGGEPGHITIQSDFFFNKDLEYLRYGRKIGRPALSISKMKAAFYPDVGLEQLVPDQFWIEEECKYDIAAMYGISHWWFQRQRFYIDRFSSEGDRRAVRTHMRILSVVRIEVFSMYGYNYMKKIILRRADLKEYVIAERDFKYMYPSDFEDLYLLNLQGHLNHLSPDDKKVLTTTINLWTRNLVIRQRVEDFQLGIESYQTQLNLTKPRWAAIGFEFKHDYTVIDSPRAVTFRDRYGSQQDKSKDEYKILDEERRCQKQGVHVCYPKMAKDMTYLPESGKLCWWTDSRRRLPEILLKMNLPDHRIKLWWKWRYLVPVESIHSPMLTLNVFNQRHHDNQKTYNTASATLISNVMIKKSVSMPVRKSQRHMKIGMSGPTDGANVEVNLRGLLGLGKRTSVFMSILVSLAPSEVPLLVRRNNLRRNEAEQNIHEDWGPFAKAQQAHVWHPYHRVRRDTDLLAWRRLFDIRGPLVHELILEFFSTFRLGEGILELDTLGALQFQLGGARRRMSWRDFILAMRLHTAEEMQTVGFDFLGTAPSYTAIRDPILRLCHRLIACSIAGRSQAPKKVTVTDLFYLRGMDVDWVNVPYLLARYLRLFAAERKSGAHISGGQFVARLAVHFGLLTTEILGGLTVIVPELPIIDMAELIRLQICVDIDDTWAWAVLVPVQAPQHPPPPPPLAAARTMPQRMARLEEDVHEIRGTLTRQCEVIDAMAHDFLRFSTWVTTSLARMMDRVGVTCTSYSVTPREYKRRRVRQRTGEASTSTAQQDQQQLDP